MKKIILLLFGIFLMSGCSVNYTVTIADHQYREQVSIQAETKHESDMLQDDPWPIPAYYDAPVTSEEPVMLDGVSYLKKDVLEKNGYQSWLLSYNYPSSQYRKSTAIHSCFESIYYDYDESSNTTVFQSSVGAYCMDDYPDISNLTIQVLTEYDILNHNADQVLGQTLIWNVTRDNYKSTSIQLALKGEVDGPKQEEKEVNQDHTGFALIILGAFLFFVVGILVYNYNQRKNHMDV